jgi:anti-anti-sigma factor
MEVTEEAAGEVTIVSVAGRLDAAAARQFTDHLTALTGSGHSHLLIEASKLHYIGSLGLRALLIASGRAAAAQSRFALCGLTASVQHVIELGGFGGLFEQYASREEALATMLCR